MSIPSDGALKVEPVVTRTPGAAYTTSQSNIWTSIKGAAGTFVKKILVPAGQATLLSLFNPETGKAAQLAYNLSTNESETSALTNTMTFGYNFLTLSKLAPTVLNRLRTVLGADPLKLRNLLVSTKAISST